MSLVSARWQEVEIDIIGGQTCRCQSSQRDKVTDGPAVRADTFSFEARNVFERRLVEQNRRAIGTIRACAVA
jgi:hypothetical protein